MLKRLRNSFIAWEFLICALVASAASSGVEFKLVQEKAGSNSAGQVTFFRSGLADEKLEFLVRSSAGRVSGIEEAPHDSALRLESGGRLTEMSDSYATVLSLCRRPLRPGVEEPIAFHLIALDPNSGVIRESKNLRFLVEGLLTRLGKNFAGSYVLQYHVSLTALEASLPVTSRINIVILGLTSGDTLKRLPPQLGNLAAKLANPHLLGVFLEPGSFRLGTSEAVLKAADFKTFKMDVKPKAGERERDWEKLTTEIAQEIEANLGDLRVVPLKSSVFGADRQRDFEFSFDKGATIKAVGQVSGAGQAMLQQEAIRRCLDDVLKAPTAQMFRLTTKLLPLLPMTDRVSFTETVSSKTKNRFGAAIRQNEFKEVQDIINSYKQAPWRSGVILESLERELVNAVKERVATLTIEKRFIDAEVLAESYIPGNMRALIKKDVAHAAVLYSLRNADKNGSLAKAEQWYSEFASISRPDEVAIVAVVALGVVASQKEMANISGGKWFERLRKVDRSLSVEETTTMRSWLTRADNIGDLVDRAVQTKDVQFCRELLSNGDYLGRNWFEFALGNAGPWKSAVEDDFVKSREREDLVLLSAMEMCNLVRPIAEIFARAYTASPADALAAINDAQRIQIQSGWRLRAISVSVVERKEIPYQQKFVESHLANNKGGYFFARREGRAGSGKVQYDVFKSLNDGKVLRITLNGNLTDAETEFWARVQNDLSLRPKEIISRVQFSMARDTLLMALTLYSRSYYRAPANRKIDFFFSPVSPLAGLLPPAFQQGIFFVPAEETKGVRNVLAYPNEASAVLGIPDLRQVDFVDPTKLELTAPVLRSRFGTPLQEVISGPNGGPVRTRLYGSLVVELQFNPQPTIKK